MSELAEQCDKLGTAAKMPRAPLGDGNSLPSVGLGLYYTPPGAATYDIVAAALWLGYRHLDTAGFYENEADVGRAVRDSGVPRDEIHITSKVLRARALSLSYYY